MTNAASSVVAGTEVARQEPRGERSPRNAERSERPNRGERGRPYGDDQQKNIGATARQLSMLRDKRGKTMTPAQADAAAAVVLKKFSTTAYAPIPRAVVRMLPPSHQSAFARLPVGRFLGAVTDHLLAHLQMVKGGAQPFWTVGVGSPTAVDYTVNAQGEWSETK